MGSGASKSKSKAASSEQPPWWVVSKRLTGSTRTASSSPPKAQPDPQTTESDPPLSSQAGVGRARPPPPPEPPSGEESIFGSFRRKKMPDSVPSSGSGLFGDNSTGFGRAVKPLTGRIRANALPPLTSKSQVGEESTSGKEQTNDQFLDSLAENAQRNLKLFANMNSPDVDECLVRSPIPSLEQLNQTQNP
eukprot:6771412-Pyramimonas_sp.AAC.2